MRALLEACDWTGAALPAPPDWPLPLRTAAGIMLAAPQPALIVWGGTQALLGNDACAALLERDPVTWLGRPLQDVWPDLSALLAPVASGQAVWEPEQRLLLPRAGRAVEAWLAVSASPIRSEQGHVMGALCLLEDVTARVQAARRQFEELKFRRWLFEQTPSFIAALSGPDHVYRLVNQAYLQLVGHQDIVGKPIREVLPELAGQGVLEVLDQVYRSGQPFGGRALRFMLQRNSSDAALEERFLDIVFQPIKDDEGKVLGVLIEGFDVTDRMEAEAALRRQAEALQNQIDLQSEDLRQVTEVLHQAQKMEALGQLTGGIAHDFNNILLGINGALGLAKRRLLQGRSDETERFINLAMQSANRAAGLVHRLLAFARRQPLAPKPVRVGALIASMADLLRHTVGEHIEVSLLPGEDDWLALCDPNQLESAILNLAINARDAMPAGGKLTITSKKVRIGAADEQVGRPGDYVCVLVSDTGTGMTPQTLRHVFEPFFTTKAAGQGTGLGLPMIYGFARQSGGSIHIDSAPGMGTTVRLYLPRSLTDAETEESAAELAPPAAASDAVVLVVEDDVTVRQLVVAALHELGLRTLEAVDGVAGLELLESDVRLDLLITDIGLPGLNGKQMVEAARAFRPQLPVLYMTAYAPPEWLDAAGPAAREALITKPFSMEALAARIRQLMA